MTISVVLSLDNNPLKYNNFQMLNGFFLRIKLTPLFIIINIILFVTTIMIFRFNVVEREKAVNWLLSRDLASSIDNYFIKKQEIVRSISTIGHIIKVSSGKVAAGEQDLITNLDTIKKMAGSSFVFLMDTEGLVLGSSSYDNSKTLIGDNYKFRPYFINAMKGENSFYMAVGTTTGLRGMYFGFPIRTGKKITGVIAVKFNLTSIDEIIKRSKLSAGVVSPDGIIFSAYKRKWLFNSLTPLSSKKLNEIKKSRQLGGFEIKYFPYDISQGEIRSGDKHYFVETFWLKIPGWKLFSISTLDTQVNYFYPFVIFLVFVFIELMIINSVRDYRFKKKSEQSLKESRERFQYLFESAMDSILILDHKRIIIAANPVTEKIFGYSVKELEGLKFRILFHGDAQRECLKHVRIVEVELRGRIEFHGRKKDGSDLYVDCSMVYLSGDNKENSTFFVTCSDITERKETDILLQNAKVEAEKANQSKGEFLANMSHEIRTPMTAILGFSELLEVSELTEKQKEYIEVIKNSGESLLYLIDEILDFSKIEAGKVVIEKKNFEFRKFIDEIEKTINIWIKDKKIELKFNIDKKVPQYLCGDPERLRQILRNILNNAIKFTEKGEITLDVLLRKKLDPWVSLEFIVSDTGIGISKNDTNKLFKSFSQIDSALSRKYEGTGLGLAITSRLVEMMGGTLDVESDLGKGTRFSFIINFGEADHAENDENTLEKKGKRQINNNLSDYSILIVEDNSVNRMLLDYTLKREGFDVDTAVDGDEAMRLLGEKKFDIILMDIQMPGKDGVEVTREIRKTSHKDVPVIALTANAMKGDMEKYINLGLDDYLSKPIKKRDLVNTVIKWIVESKG